MPLSASGSKASDYGGHAPGTGTGVSSSSDRGGGERPDTRAATQANLNATQSLLGTRPVTTSGGNSNSGRTAVAPKTVLRPVQIAPKPVINIPTVKTVTPPPAIPKSVLGTRYAHQGAMTPRGGIATSVASKASATKGSLYTPQNRDNR